LGLTRIIDLELVEKSRQIAGSKSLLVSSMGLRNVGLGILVG
jgi:hypothetical protein